MLKIFNTWIKELYIDICHVDQEYDGGRTVPAHPQNRLRLFRKGLHCSWHFWEQQAYRNQDGITSPELFTAVKGNSKLQSPGGKGVPKAAQTRHLSWQRVYLSGDGFARTQSWRLIQLMRRQVLSEDHSYVVLPVAWSHRSHAWEKLHS